MMHGVLEGGAQRRGEELLFGDANEALDEAVGLGERTQVRQYSMSLSAR